MTSSSGWSEQLLQLESFLEHQRPAEISFGTFGDPLHLGTLFRLELCRLVRSGPPRTPTRIQVGGLLRAAQRAAGAGSAPISLPASLRRSLKSLSRELRARGCWNPHAPLWWEPLPVADEIEQLGATVSMRMPGDRRLGPGLTGSGGGFVLLPQILEPKTLGRIYREVKGASRKGLLSLAGGRVGPDARRSTARNDQAAYLNGFQSALVEAAPALAALIQWGLVHPVQSLRRALKGIALGAPQRAMLSCFPAPSGGFAPHLDNPGGNQDNGRVFTLVIYLNDPDNPCRGGELSAWRAGLGGGNTPSWSVPARGGDAVLFDSRRILHQVCPLEAGPPRWALTFWFNDKAPGSAASPRLPELSWRDALRAVDRPPLPSRTILLRDLSDASREEKITNVSRGKANPRLGIVTTAAGAGPLLDGWCRHHLDLGFDRLIVVLDDLGGDSAQVDRLATLSPTRLVIWTGQEAACRWSGLESRYRDELLPFTGGPSSQAVACRQSLNASAALAAAQNAEFGNSSLDWLLHIDLDEWFWPLGEGHGGARAVEHFAALSSLGWDAARYLNHELLLPLAGKLSFKMNPRLAAERLGSSGWRHLQGLLESSSADRPYFCAYQNGKAAVRVAAAAAAAGVHGWTLKEPSGKVPWLNGPVILHFPAPSPEAFRRKFSSKAESAPLKPSFFEPSPVETAALELIGTARERGSSEEALARQLASLHESLTHFSEIEWELLEEAGLLFRPDTNRASSLEELLHE